MDTVIPFPQSLDVFPHIQDKLMVKEYDKRFVIGSQPISPPQQRLSDPTLAKYLSFDEFKKHFDSLSKTGVPMSRVLLVLNRRLQEGGGLHRSILRTSADLLRHVVSMNLNTALQPPKPVTAGNLNWLLSNLETRAMQTKAKLTMNDVARFVRRKEDSLYIFMEHYIGVFDFYNYLIELEEAKQKCNNLFCYRVVVLGRYTTEYYLYSMVLGMMGLSQSLGGVSIADVYPLNNDGQNNELKRHTLMLVSRLIELSRSLERDQMIISTAFGEVKSSAAIVRQQNDRIKVNMDDISTSQGHLSVLVKKDADNKRLLTKTRWQFALLFLFVVLYIAAFVALFMFDIPGASAEMKAYAIVGVNATVALVFVLMELYKLVKSVNS